MHAQYIGGLRKKKITENRSVNILTSILFMLSISPLHDPKSVKYVDVSTSDGNVGALASRCMTCGNRQLYCAMNIFPSAFVSATCLGCLRKKKTGHFNWIV